MNIPAGFYFTIADTAKAVYCKTAKQSVEDDELN